MSFQRSQADDQARSTAEVDRKDVVMADDTAATVIVDPAVHVAVEDASVETEADRDASAPAEVTDDQSDNCTH